MNKHRDVSILLLLLASDLGFLQFSQACNDVSFIECVNSTSFFWCVDSGNGTLVTIGDPQFCPGILVCDDSQVNACVSPDTVTSTEISLDSTTASPTTIVPTTVAPTATNSTPGTLLTTTPTSAAASTEETTINVAADSTTTGKPCSISDADFTCTFEGLYKAEDCSRFHVCYKIIWFIQHYFARCPKGLYWSSDEKQCVLQRFSDCP